MQNQNFFATTEINSNSMLYVTNWQTSCELCGGQNTMQLLLSLVVYVRVSV